jgi:prophage regulatory protein
MDEFLRLKAVLQRSGLSRATIYDYIARDLFPPPKQLGPRRVGWAKSDIDAWVASRPSTRAKEGGSHD